MKNLFLEIKAGIARLTIDLENEKVNKLSIAVLEEFDEVLDSIKDNSSIKALVITSAKKNVFIAGADIEEIEQLEDEKEVYDLLMRVHTIFNKLENLEFPSIAYINGACMGGGLELALACTHRVATTSDKTKLAFPEVKLGIFPGFAGCLRAPKVVGLINSLDLILSGKTIDAKKAYRIRLVDEVFHDGQKESKLESFIQRVIYNKVKSRRKFNLFETWPLREIVFSKTLKTLEKKVNKDFEAPYKALEVIKDTYARSFKQGIKVEAREFSRLAVTKESKNMIKLFFTFQKLNKNFDKTDNPISSSAILGNGVMGKGIIWLFSKYLKEVRIKVRKIEQVQGILKDVAKIYDFLIKTRRMTANQVGFKLNDISYTEKFDGLSNTDFAIEAIIEDEKAKKEAYKELEKVLKPDAIIATNTSSISIEKLGSELKNKENFLGVHFFNPVNMMPLVEVIPSSHTSKETINKVFELLTSCGKTPILVGDCAGFIVNRILLPYLNEAAFILEEVPDIKRIDKVVKNFGMPMGPFTLADTVGIDIGYKVASILKEAYGERMPISPIIEKIYNKKELGIKTGSGFYTYNKKEKIVNNNVTSMLEKSSKLITDEQIINRCIYIMINEASRCLEEGIVDDPTIIDFAMVTGTGFPPYKGGLCNLANEIGIKNIVKTLQELEKDYGSRFTPSNLLIKLLEDDKDFNTGETLWKL
ncbi:3-hydroxyacyl-CoA dehydrogenase NAD-binding domain-containing protein [Poseidonibacter lekithochrous]|uniref:3-hydroxyacyl-CoA dehydrogenase NAD-binding domain-containing protein n=1 Tax=Poseidonibacter lekithochrous TaxID=1904463 RepID=UPI0008FC40BA|nr:3-hydroxyacyl-CoA dehydrogenase NAD-binding domain-containing protein [Poseidonibacter lekithochrous]QKJ22734.1 3-hydroxyacyl-CoA dehydrogenase [Poseidonibacter lekithochrous]